jgi:hypothetical protein
VPQRSDGELGASVIWGRSKPDAHRATRVHPSIRDGLRLRRVPQAQEVAPSAFPKTRWFNRTSLRAAEHRVPGRSRMARPLVPARRDPAALRDGRATRHRYRLLITFALPSNNGHTPASPRALTSSTPSIAIRIIRGQFTIRAAP